MNTQVGGMRSTTKMSQPTYPGVMPPTRGQTGSDDILGVPRGHTVPAVRQLDSPAFAQYGQSLTAFGLGHQEVPPHGVHADYSETLRSTLVESKTEGLSQTDTVSHPPLSTPLPQLGICSDPPSHPKMSVPPAQDYLPHQSENPPLLQTSANTIPNDLSNAAVALCSALFGNLQPNNSLAHFGSWSLPSRVPFSHQPHHTPILPPQPQCTPRLPLHPQPTASVPPQFHTPPLTPQLHHMPTFPPQPHHTSPHLSHSQHPRHVPPQLQHTQLHPPPVPPQLHPPPVPPQLHPPPVPPQLQFLDSNIGPVNERWKSLSSQYNDGNDLKRSDNLEISDVLKVVRSNLEQDMPEISQVKEEPVNLASPYVAVNSQFTNASQNHPTSRNEYLVDSVGSPKSYVDMDHQNVHTRSSPAEPTIRQEEQLPHLIHHGLSSIATAAHKEAPIATAAHKEAPICPEARMVPTKSTAGDEQERKSREKELKKEDLKRAIADVKGGKLKPSEAIQKYKVSKSTLHRHLTLDVQNHGGNFLLTAEEEAFVVECAKVMGGLGLGFNRREMTKLIVNILEKKGNEKMPSRSWLDRFQKRYEHILSKRTPQNYSRNRAVAGNQEEHNLLFNQLEALYDLHDYQPEAIINFDEKPHGSDPGQEKIFVAKGSTDAKRLSNDNQKSKTSVLHTAVANGTMLPPLVIYRGKSVMRAWTEGGPEGTMYAANETGNMTKDLMLQVFQNILVPYADSIDGRLLALADGFRGHISQAIIRLCVEHEIDLFIWPSHTSDTYQPCDKGLFGPAQAHWRTLIRQHLHSTGFSNIEKTDFPVLLRKLYESSVFSVTNIKNSFQGFCPLDRKFVKEEVLQKTLVFNDVPIIPKEVPPFIKSNRLLVDPKTGILCSEASDENEAEGSNQVKKMICGNLNEILKDLLRDEAASVIVPWVYDWDILEIITVWSYHLSASNSFKMILDQTDLTKLRELGKLFERNNHSDGEDGVLILALDLLKSLRMKVPSHLEYNLTSNINILRESLKSRGLSEKLGDEEESAFQAPYFSSSSSCANLSPTSVNITSRVEQKIVCQTPEFSSPSRPNLVPTSVDSKERLEEEEIVLSPVFHSKVGKKLSTRSMRNGKLSQWNGNEWINLETLTRQLEEPDKVLTKSITKLDQVEMCNQIPNKVTDKEECEDETSKYRVSVKRKREAESNCVAATATNNKKRMNKCGQSGYKITPAVTQCGDKFISSVTKFEDTFSSDAVDLFEDTHYEEKITAVVTNPEDKISTIEVAQIEESINTAAVNQIESNISTIKGNVSIAVLTPPKKITDAVTQPGDQITDYVTQPEDKITSVFTQPGRNITTTVSKSTETISSSVPQSDGKISPIVSQLGEKNIAESEVLDDVTNEKCVKCPCQLDVKDDRMLFCLQCGTLQHSVCFNIEESNQIESHTCLECSEKLDTKCTDYKLRECGDKNVVKMICLYRRVVIALLELSTISKVILSHASKIGDMGIIDVLWQRLLNTKVIHQDTMGDHYVVDRNVLRLILIPQTFGWDFARSKGFAPPSDSDQHSACLDRGQQEEEMVTVTSSRGTVSVPSLKKTLVKTIQQQLKREPRRKPTAKRMLFKVEGNFLATSELIDKRFTEQREKEEKEAADKLKRKEMIQVNKKAKELEREEKLYQKRKLMEEREKLKKAKEEEKLKLIEARKAKQKEKTQKITGKRKRKNQE